MGALTLEIVTPLGVAFEAAGLDEIVLRRREPVFDPGSEIAIFARHAPMLVLTPESDVRFRRGETTQHVHVGPGVAEVLDDTVTLLTPSVGA